MFICCASSGIVIDEIPSIREEPKEQNKKPCLSSKETKSSNESKSTLPPSSPTNRTRERPDDYRIEARLGSLRSKSSRDVLLKISKLITTPGIQRLPCNNISTSSFGSNGVGNGSSQINSQNDDFAMQRSQSTSKALFSHSLELLVQDWIYFTVRFCYCY